MSRRYASSINILHILYIDLFDTYIVYIYVLSDWFKHNCEAELQNLDEIGIKYFWGNSDTYKDDIINYIVNCK